MARLSPVGWPLSVKRGDRTMATTAAELEEISEETGGGSRYGVM